MPRRRVDPERCANGHDLSLDANRFTAPTGKIECRRCAHDRVRRHRLRHGYRDPVTHREPDGAPSATEVEAMLRKALEEEIAMPWDKPPHRRMWQPRGTDADRQR